MMKRAYNFNAGPAALPQAVLERAQREMFDFNGTGMGLMELSHRSKEYDEVHNTAEALVRELLQVPDNYDVLFLQGGASLQFTMVPMNLLNGDKIGHYVLTGSWSEKALKEAKKVGNADIMISSKENQYRNIPKLTELSFTDQSAYLHITSNNTIYGTQWHEFPKNLPIPLVADMSSDIMSKPLNIEDFGLIYAGAQKNLGPSGVTLVIIRKDLVEKASDTMPTMLNYRTHASNQSLYNTPPTIAIYLLKLVLEWVKEQGGVTEIEKMNKQKAKILYDAIDESNGFYQGHADKDSRSLMNVTFILTSDELTKAFLAEAKQRGFVGLNGHRSIGGCRASIYNAVPIEHVEKLVEFMKEFQQKNE